MSTPTLRIVPSVEAVTRAETVAEVTDCYVRMADELAGMVEAEAQRSAQAHALIADALGALHAALDELATLVQKGQV